MKQQLKRYSKNLLNHTRYAKIFRKYHTYTMIPKDTYMDNLNLIEQYKNIPGCVVECGVWRGGMSAGIADVLGANRSYYLFDSFEGLPEAKPIDGESAIAWQKNIHSPDYFENCKAEMSWAEEALQLSAAKNYFLMKGWFNETLPTFNVKEEIAILRLDGDWYESTMDCLVNLFPKVASGGLIVLDDYYLWDGCTKAVHDYLSKNSIPARIKQFNNGNIHYLIKP